MIKPAKRRTLSQDVIAQLIELIRTEKWKAGEKIPGELELAAGFMLSRNSVREALKALVHSGILESKAGQGTFVTAGALRNLHSMELAEMMRDESSFVELLESRLIIEPQLAYIAAQKASPEEVEALAQAVKRTEAAYLSNTYSLEIGFEFHRIIAAIANNRFLMKYIDSIKDELKLQRGMLLLSHMSGEDLKRELDEHRNVFELIREHEAEQAREAMHQHLETALNILRKSYRLSKEA